MDCVRRPASPRLAILATPSVVVAPLYGHHVRAVANLSFHAVPTMSTDMDEFFPLPMEPTVEAEELDRALAEATPSEEAAGAGSALSLHSDPRGLPVDAFRIWLLHHFHPPPHLLRSA